MAASAGAGPGGEMLATLMGASDLDFGGIDTLDNPSLRLDNRDPTSLERGCQSEQDFQSPLYGQSPLRGQSPLDNASALEEAAGSWEAGPDSESTREFPSSGNSDSFTCSHSEEASGDFVGGAEGPAYAPQGPFTAPSQAQGGEAQAMGGGDTEGTSFALEGLRDSEPWWAAAAAGAPGPGPGELDVSDMGLMLNELGWLPDGGSALPIASEQPQSNGPATATAAASLPFHSGQPPQQSRVTGREDGREAFVDGAGSTGEQWRVDWTSQSVNDPPLDHPDIPVPRLAAQLDGQSAGHGIVPASSASALPHGNRTEQVYASGVPVHPRATSFPGLGGGSAVGRAQSVLGMASGLPQAGRAFPPYAAAQSARDTSQAAPDPGAKRKRGRKKSRPEPVQEPKGQALPPKLAPKVEPLVPKASLESKPADLAARLAMLVGRPDQAEASTPREAGQGDGCTAGTPGFEEARLLLEELDEQGEEEQEVLAEGDRGYSKAMRAGAGASAPGAPPGSQADGAAGRDPTEWSMPEGGSWGPGDGAQRSRAFGSPGAAQQNWQELFAALGPSREPPGHTLELADLTSLEGPGESLSWLASGAPAATQQLQGGGSGGALALGPTRRPGLRGPRDAALPWEATSGGLEVARVSVAMGAGGQRGAGSIRVWSLPRVILEAMSPTDCGLRERLLCVAEAVAVGDTRVETALIPALQRDASPRGSPVQRIVHYFVDALKKRLRGDALHVAGRPAMPSPAVMRTMEGVEMMRFMEQMPYRPFWLQASTSYALQAVAGHARVHIVEISPWIGAWRIFFCELAAAKGRRVRVPPGREDALGDAWAFPRDWELSKVFSRIARQTESSEGVGHPSGDAWRQPLFIRFTAVMIPGGSPRGSGPPVSLPALQEELSVLAAEAGVGLEFSAVHLPTGLPDFRPSTVECRPGEVLVVNTNTHLESLLDDSVLRSNPRDNFLKALRALEPAAILVSNMEYELNLPFFLKRFNNALSMFLALFHSFDDSSSRSSEARIAFEARVLGRVILNLVASEGSFVHMRAETLRTMRRRMAALGLQPLPLSPAGLQQLQGVLQAYPASYDVRLRKGCPQLSWAGIPMVAASAWKPSTVYSSDSE